ncbi:Lnb N-terminal periplasmic domain-containing protein [Antarcticirhabdus aurantiaca]|uniref:DUF4105 domain-containing protein n=1 Tax=Antarcticirhabdus aurantiaca TaxID=2606717 RepID=A0ACD4NP29_9HYPH|nr:DUF4105 domain-containing protein [Antarcticirhabdus aurantiaca]WAJ28400.1 DUF4105 domain-containing protein [Jeongeuplla avenae]
MRATRCIGKALLALAAVGFCAWSVLALWYQGDGPDSSRLGLILSWLGLLVVAFWLDLVRPRWGVALAAVMTMSFCAWWWTIEPRLDRDWSPDVAHIATGSRDGSVVTLDNVRDFDWTAPDQGVVRWHKRQYDLATIASVDVVLSYWGIDAIAHTLVSFGFTDGRHVVFSVEIRKERGEEFSSLAGFFKTYELALVAAEERDILYLRTNVRREDTYLYPLTMPREDMQALFLEYLDTGNRLAREPAFYDTLTANCTTVVFDLARMIEPGAPFDWRIVLSGFLPSYLADSGVLAWGGEQADLERRAAIGARANSIGAAAVENYSDLVRSRP